MTTYRSTVFATEPDWDAVPVGTIGCFQWEAVDPFRPQSFFQLCFVKDRGVFCRLWTDETAPRCVCTHRDDPVYEDSCLEVFFQPLSGKGYLNVEMNPRGVFLCEYGTGRDDRVFVKALTDVSPVVTPMARETGWGVTVCLPCRLIEDVCGGSFSAAAGTYAGGFFKCGDKTKTPHYASVVPLGSNPPGFHDPKTFIPIIIEEEHHGIIQKNH